MTHGDICMCNLCMENKTKGDTIYGLGKIIDQFDHSKPKTTSIAEAIGILSARQTKSQAATLEIKVPTEVQERKAQIQAFEADLTTLKNYLDLCRKKEDWHGVRDACVDIECLIVRLETLKNVK